MALAEQYACLTREHKWACWLRVPAIPRSRAKAVRAQQIPQSGAGMKKLLIASMLATAGLGSLAGCAITDKQSSVGNYVDDSTITARVKSRFAQDPQVSAMRINVETLQGVVQLSGFATSSEEKTRAAELAGEVPAVQNVRNNIIVKAPTG
jgi:hyperosmotically inducible protein